jgi:peptide/nickel transport system substrate-binding protein
MVDAATIANRLYPLSPVGAGLVSEALPGHLTGYYKFDYDLEKAEEELKKSIYYDRLDEMVVELVWNSENPEREQIMLWMQAEAAKLGIRTTIVQLTWMQMMDLVATADRTPNSAVIWTSPSYAEAGSILKAQYTTPTVGTWETMDWVSIPEVDALIDEALSTIDDEARFELYRNVQKILIENCVTIPLCDIWQRHAYQTEYLVWPVAERANAGKSVVPIMGYPNYVREMQFFPDKK